MQKHTNTDSYQAQNQRSEVRYKRRRSRRIWRNCVSVMACIVVFCVTYALILPAITMEKETFCGLQAHVHEAQCYAGTSIVCDPAGDTGLPILHTHDALCYEGEKLHCTLPELSGHVHTDACYETVTTEAHTHDESCKSFVRGGLTCTTAEEAGHKHSDGCYVPGQTLICTEAEREGHAHGDSCYTLGSELTCTLAEGEEHTHGEGCYSETKTLTCEIPEDPGHTHENACYEQVLNCGQEEREGHTHTDACYEMVETIVCGKEEVAETSTVHNLICGQTQIAPHTHDGSCNDENGNLICTIQNAIVHQHTEECVQPSQNEENLICEQAVHEHTLICYSDPNADLETAQDWEKTFADLELTGDWCQDVVALAKTQLGYEESTKNYIVEGENPKGYTRYGAWYGIPYGDWCAMFASFCLDYAGVEGMPLDCNCPNWINTLNNQNLYQTSGGYAPQSGDLIFFDWNADNSSDHVGIVVEFTPADGETQATVRTIEGNSGNCVKYNEYNLDDATIMGYGAIPAQLTEEEQAQVDYVIGLIDAMPSSDEIDAKIEEFEEAEDYEGEETWLTEVYQQVVETYKAYSELSEEQKTCVTNADKLLELEYIWSVMVLPEDVTEELTEEAADTTVYHCGYSDEHAHGDGATCLMVDGNCVLPEHSHSEECAAEHIVYCEKTAHVHTSSCYGEDGVLTCIQETHIHEDNCYLEPDAEGSLAGADVYHSPYNLKYQESSHNLDGFGVVTFVLIPSEYVGDDKGESWEPNTIEWNSRVEANYVVAYCSDAMTSTSSSGAYYSTFTLDNARFTSDEQRRVLAGIIANSYPFITASEMKANLEAAYNAGEITEPLVLNASETEYMAASQWAIWQTTLLAQSFTYAAGAEFEYSDQCLNPLTNVGMTDDTEINTTVKAIKNWLVQQMEPVELGVESYEYSVTPVDFGLFDLEVMVNLNRPVEPGERAEYVLTVGSASTDLQLIEVGADTFTVKLSALTQEELTKAQVQLTVGGEHMQAYFYDSNNHQDLISGNWEYYSEDLSFEVGIDTIDISVTKNWTDGSEDAPEVTVQLIANGEICGDPVKLNESNEWCYIWKDMLAKDALGNDIEYTIQEQLLDGYYSQLDKYGTDEVDKIRLWEQVDTIEPDGQYVLISKFINEAGLWVSTGALSWSENDSRDTSTTEDRLSWNAVDISSVNKTSPNAIWTTTSGENGGFYLQNNGDGMWLYGSYGTIKLYSTNKTEYYFINDLLAADSAGTRVFMDIFSNGYGQISTDLAVATSFVPYKLVEKEVPKGDVNFVLTNTKYVPIVDTGAEKVSVTKSWAGRPDAVYPGSATVQLLQDNRLYGDPVELNADNNWTYTWTDLPKQVSINGVLTDITYSVAEVELKDYSAVVTRDSETEYSFTITNNWEPEEAAVKLQKADFHDPEKLLAGAEFDLYLTTNNTGDSVPGTDNVLGVKLNTESLIVGQDGTITLPVVPGESYYLVETKAPDGYNRMEEPIGFSVSKRGTRVTLTLLSGTDWAVTESGTTAILTVKNKIGYVLPETGGTGTQMYTMAGLMLMLISTAFLLYRCRKRRREVP